MVKILKGPAGAGKSTCLYRTVLRLAEENKDKNHILCVPEQFTLSAMKLIMEMSQVRGMLNIDVLSFNRLSYRIFQDAGSGKYELLDDTAKNLIIRHIASERREDLKVFGSNLRKQGYVSAVKSAISELMQYGCSLSDLDRMIGASEDSGSFLSLKLRDIKIIYEEFLKRLGTDYTTVEELYNAAAKKADSARFLKGAVVYFDGFTGFTPVQYNLIKSLYNVCSDLYVTVTDDGSGCFLFNTGIKTIEKLSIISKGNIVEEDTPDRIVRHKDDPVFTFLGENVFRRNTDRIENRDHIRFIRAGDIESEIKSVLYHIKKLTLTENYRYRDIAIILTDIAEYADTLKKEAKRNGIPVYVDETKGIEFNPFARFIRAALRCVIEDMSYESVFNLLRTQMTGLDACDIDMAENYVLALKIKGMNRYEKPFGQIYKGVDENELNAANKVRQSVLTMVGPLWEIRKSASVKEFTTRLYELCRDIGVKEKLDIFASEFAQENDTVRQMEFKQVYQLIMQLYDRMVSLLGDEVMDIEEYAQIVDAGLSEIKIGTIPSSSDCIMAGDLTRSRFNEIKALFIIGMDEGNIPGNNDRGGIITDADRRFLKEMDFELAPTTYENALVSAFYFYMNILKPSDRLFLSYSETSRDGGIKRPSYFLKEVKRCLTEPSEERAEDNLQDIYTRSDALDRLSETVGENGSHELYEALKDDACAKVILDGHFKEDVSMLLKAAADAVFGKRSQESATELERYAACAYAHYLQYGLGLRERLEFEFDASDIGTLLHETLKNYSYLLKRENTSFPEVGDELSRDLLREALEMSGSEKLERLYERSGRNAYMKQRMERIAKRTVDTLRFQSGEGRFSPSAFEKSFSAHGLKGFIDRIDRYEEGQDVYLEVIDYKSGSKNYDSDRVMWGLDLQLVIYMSAAMEMEIKASEGKKNVHPAGFFYYHIDDPVVDGEGTLTEDDILSKIRSELKLRGIVNGDGSIPEYFDKKIGLTGKSDVIKVSVKTDGTYDSRSRVVSEEDMLGIIDHTLECVERFKKEIKEGHAEKNPYELNGSRACDYCSYRSICDGGIPRKL